MRLKIRLDEDLDGFLASMHFDADRCIGEIDLVPATVLPTDNCMRHFRVAPSETNQPTITQGVAICSVASDITAVFENSKRGRQLKRPRCEAPQHSAGTEPYLTRFTMRRE